MTTPPLLAGLFDDASIFPPGDLPLDRAIPAHGLHERAPYGAMVGPFVVAAANLGKLAEETDGMPASSLPLAMTVPVDALADAVARASEIPAVRLVGLEVTVPEGTDPAQIESRVRRDAPAGVAVAIEVPRDDRRRAVIAALAGTGLTAKLRTGGIRAELYPDEHELAESIALLAAAGVPFKATAGLHHAVRNTDPETGFEQHGFLNVLIATARARDGGSLEEVRAALAERDATKVTDSVRQLHASVRDGFRSFGTCSIDEPVGELVELGLLPEDLLQKDR